MASDRKNTRLLYRDEKNLLLIKSIHKIDRALLGDLFLALMEYDSQTKQTPSWLDKDSIIYPIFLDQKDKIDHNEDKWRNDGRSKTSAENGRKHKKKEQENELVDYETGEIMNVPEYDCLNDTGITVPNNVVGLVRSK